MPTKRELLEEILRKMDSIEQSQSEMNTSIRELQSSQFSMKQSIHVLESLGNRSIESNLNLQLAESGLESPSSDTQNKNYINELFALFQATQNSISLSITELHSELNRIKSTLSNLENKEKLNTDKLTDLISKSSTKIEDTKSSISNLQITVNQVKNNIHGLHTSHSVVKDKLEELNISQNILKSSLEDLKPSQNIAENQPEETSSTEDIVIKLEEMINSHNSLKNQLDEMNISQVELKTAFNELPKNLDSQTSPIDMMIVDNMKTSLEHLQNTVGEIKNSIFELQAAQSISNVTVNEIQSTQNNLQNAIAELQVSNIELNNAVYEVTSSQTNLRETIAEWKVTEEQQRKSFEATQTDLQPITSQIEKCSNRINILKNYVDHIHDDIEKLFEEINTIKGHSIKNSTLLTPLNHIVPKILQIETDMNVLKKQLESNSFQATQEMIRKFDSVKL